MKSDIITPAITILFVIIVLSFEELMISLSTGTEVLVGSLCTKEMLFNIIRWVLGAVYGIIACIVINKTKGGVM